MQLIDFHFSTKTYELNKYCKLLKILSRNLAYSGIIQKVLNIINMNNINDDDTTCGLWLFKPKWLQIFASKKSYVILYGLLGFNQSFLSSYYIGIQTTLEKRFKYSSQMSGMISSVWDLFSIFSFLFASYYGGKGHRARWLAIGFLLVALSNFIRVLPHTIYGPGSDVLKYTKDYNRALIINSSIINSTINNNKLCNDKILYKDCENLEFWNFPALILCVAHAIVGLGGSVYFTCGTAYLDDNVKKNSVPLLLATTQCIRMMGPALGFAFSAYTLNKFVNPSLTPVITSEDPRWIGAWWMGWVPLGTFTMLCACLVGLFPQALPKAVARKNEQSKNNTKDLMPTDLKSSMKRILSNKVMMCNSLSSSFFILGLVGYWNFMPKYLETQFRQSASTSNFASGSVSLLCSGLGIIVSGAIISKFKPATRKLALWNVIVESIEVMTYALFTLIECSSNDSLNGHFNVDNKWNFSMSCNDNCNCDPTIDYNPICSYDNTTSFYSACHAGCSQSRIVDGIKWYSNCTCIRGKGMAYEGLCPANCNQSFIFFLIILGFIRFISSTGRSGNSIIQLRSVDEQDKSLALGFTEMLVTFVGFLPGPILYGTILDTTCLIWSYNCGKRGNCWLYDRKLMKYYLNSISSGFLVIGTLFDVGVWYYVKDLKIYDEDNDLKPNEICNSSSMEAIGSLDNLEMKTLK